MTKYKIESTKNCQPPSFFSCSHAERYPSINRSIKQLYMLASPCNATLRFPAIACFLLICSFISRYIQESFVIFGFPPVRRCWSSSRASRILMLCWRVNHLTPWMLQHLANRDALLHVPIQHQSDEINAFVAHDVRHSQIVIHNLVDAVEWVLLIDNGVKEDAQRPYILLLAAIWLASEYFRRSII